MELKDFIRESLVEISQAVHEANVAYREAQKTENTAFMLRATHEKGEGTGIHFDVAVTTKAGSNVKGDRGCLNGPAAPSSPVGCYEGLVSRNRIDVRSCGAASFLGDSP